MGEREGPEMMLSQNDTGNQISRYDKEDIHTEKTAGQQAGLQVKKENGEYRHGSQAINVCAVRASSGC